MTGKPPAKTRGWRILDRLNHRTALVPSLREKCPAKPPPAQSDLSSVPCSPNPNRCPVDAMIRPLLTTPETVERELIVTVRIRRPLRRRVLLDRRGSRWARRENDVIRRWSRASDDRGRRGPGDDRAAKKQNLRASVVNPKLKPPAHAANQWRAQSFVGFNRRHSQLEIVPASAPHGPARRREREKRE